MKRLILSAALLTATVGANANEISGLHTFTSNCYLIALNGIPATRGCEAGELLANAMPGGVRGEKRQMYQGCYKQVGDNVVIRWVDGKPKHLKDPSLTWPVANIDKMEPAKGVCRTPWVVDAIPVVVVN